jgi:hypothetical protein
MANLLFKPNFDNLVISTLETDNYRVNPGWYNNLIVIWYGSTKSACWVEDGTGKGGQYPVGIFPYSGIKCMGFRSGTSGGVRAEWQLAHLDGSPQNWGSPQNAELGSLKVTGDFYVSVWLYFPSNWALPMPSGDLGYYEMQNIAWRSTDTQRFATHIHRLNNGLYDLVLHFQRNNSDYTGRVNNGNSDTYMQWWLINNLDLNQIKGWHKWAYFLHRSTDPDVAYVKYWLDDVLLKTCTRANNESLGNLGTAGFLTEFSGAWWSTFAKDYCQSDGNYHYMYIDDLEVWDDIPEIAPPVTKTLTVNSNVAGQSIPYTIKRV